MLVRDKQCACQLPPKLLPWRFPGNYLRQAPSLLFPPLLPVVFLSALCSLKVHPSANIRDIPLNIPWIHCTPTSGGRCKLQTLLAGAELAMSRVRSISLLRRLISSHPSPCFPGDSAAVAGGGASRVASLSKGAAGPGPDSTTSASAAAASWLVRSTCCSRRQQGGSGATADFLAAGHNKGEQHIVVLFDRCNLATACRRCDHPIP